LGDQAQLVEVEQIEDLEIHPLGSDGGEGLNLLGHFIDRARESVRSKLADLATDSPGSAFNLRFTLAHAENLRGRQNDRFATASFTGPANAFEL
jgi:hypothetical protein